MFQAQKLCKQAIGHYTTCLRGRVGKSGQHLLYPQVPLVNTRASRLINKDELVNGQNLVVAVCPFFGYNQEDSIVMNESSIQRGLLQSMHYKGHTTTCNKDMVTMMKPAESDARRSIKLNTAYEKLDADGLPYIGANLGWNEVIFGRVTVKPTNAVHEDKSIDLRMREKGRVDSVMVAAGEDESIIARVTLSEKRFPVVGDKFSSMHGQKGVIGYIAGQHEMPFTRQGIVPDVIINPHSFPSRQTTGQLLETHLGKLSAIKGEIRDGTAFCHQTIDAMIAELHG
jgi:DNA-directed RNA polymerase beta subunit